MAQHGLPGAQEALDLGDRRADLLGALGAHRDAVAAGDALGGDDLGLAAVHLDRLGRAGPHAGVALPALFGSRQDRERITGCLAVASPARGPLRSRKCLHQAHDSMPGSLVHRTVRPARRTDDRSPAPPPCRRRRRRRPAAEGRGGTACGSRPGSARARGHSTRAPLPRPRRGSTRPREARAPPPGAPPPLRSVTRRPPERMLSASRAVSRCHGSSRRRASTASRRRLVFSSSRRYPAAERLRRQAARGPLRHDSASGELSPSQMPARRQQLDARVHREREHGRRRRRGSSTEASAGHDGRRSARTGPPGSLQTIRQARPGNRARHESGGSGSSSRWGRGGRSHARHPAASSAAQPAARSRRLMHETMGPAPAARGVPGLSLPIREAAPSAARGCARAPRGCAGCGSRGRSRAGAGSRPSHTSM